MKDLVNKNPEDDKGQTPLPDNARTTLQIAAQIGLVYIYKQLMENLDKKYFGKNNGHLEVFEIIMKGLVNKNPEDNKGHTPLHNKWSCVHLQEAN